MLGLQSAIIQTITPSSTFGFVYDPSTGLVTEYLGDLAEHTPGDTLPDSAIPPAAQRYCGLQNADGTLNYKLKPDDWSVDIDGNAADLTGADGDVMGFFPLVYEKHWTDSSGKHYWLWSMTPQGGFTIHPLFTFEGNTGKFAAIGIYEGYRDTSVDNKLRSISGVTPTTNRNRQEFRTDANANSGFLESYFQRDYIAKLTAMKFGSFNVQTIVSIGITDVISGDWNTYNGYNPLVNTGTANSLGSGTGEVIVNIPNFPDAGTPAGINIRVPKLFGLENYWGHIREWSDQFNVLNVEGDGVYAYLCLKPSACAETNTADYTNYGKIAEADGYIDNFGDSGLLLPVRTTGSSSAGLCDYYYTDYDSTSGYGTALRGVLFSGHAHHGVVAGVCFVYAGCAPSYRSAAIGARLCRRKLEAV